MASARRLALAAVALAALAVMLAPAAPAHAAPGVSLIDDAARLGRGTLPKVRIPSTIRLAPQTDNVYGAHPAVVAQLDQAKAAEVQVAESAAQEVTTTSEAAELAKGCIQEGLKQAAQDYLDAEARQEIYPPLGESVYYGVQGCLNSTFEGAPEQAVDAVANYFANEVAGPATTVIQTEPAALANWLDVTGDELAAEPASEPAFAPPPSDTSGGDTSGDDEGSSFPWWILLLAIPIGIYVASRN